MGNCRLRVRESHQLSRVLSYQGCRDDSASPLTGEVRTRDLHRFPSACPAIPFWVMCVTYTVASPPPLYDRPTVPLAFISDCTCPPSLHGSSFLDCACPPCTLRLHVQSDMNAAGTF